MFKLRKSDNESFEFYGKDAINGGNILGYGLQGF